MEKYVIVSYNTTKVGLYFFKKMFMDAPSYSLELNDDVMQYASRNSANNMARKIKKYIKSETAFTKVLPVSEAMKLDSVEVYEKGGI